MDAERRSRGAAAAPSFLTGVALLLPITLASMAIVLLAPVLPQMMAAFAGEPGHEFWVPMILTVPALCIALFSPLAGWLGDRYGRRKLLIASLFCYAVLGVSPVFIESLPGILASRVGVGIAEALLMVLSTAMIGDTFSGEARNRWLAAQTAFASVSAVLFLNLGGQLGAMGWRTPFWAYGAALIMLALILLFTREAAVDREGAVPPDTAAADSRFPWRPMAVIMVITLFGSIFFYTVQIQASAGLAQLGVADAARIGLWTSIASVGVPLGTLIYSRIGLWPVQRLLVMEFALQSLGFCIMGLAREPTAFLIGCFFSQVGAGMLLPTLLVWAMSLLSIEIRARGAGIWGSVFAFGQFLSPVVVTLLSWQTGGLLGAFLALSAMASVGVAAIWIASFSLPGENCGRPSDGPA